MIAAKAKGRQKGGQGGVLLPQNSAEGKRGETRDELAKIAGVSHNTPVYGERVYGEMYAKAIEATGRSYADLRVIASVAQRVSVVHRLTTLSWSHHAEVARFEPQVQEAWLEIATRRRRVVRPPKGKRHEPFFAASRAAVYSWPAGDALLAFRNLYDQASGGAETGRSSLGAILADDALIGSAAHLVVQQKPGEAFTGNSNALTEE